MNAKYTRVIPRDLFNESKLLKCIGRLILMIHDNNVPAQMSFHHDGDPFNIALLDEGALTITNVNIWVKKRQFLFKTTYNSKSNFPLSLEHDYCDYRVFDDEGNFDQEFINFCKTIKSK
jgi:hypothetical protein